MRSTEPQKKLLKVGQETDTWHCKPLSPHFTQDEQNILHLGATCHLTQPQQSYRFLSWGSDWKKGHIKAQTERGTPQNLNCAGDGCSVHTGSRSFVNHMLLSPLPFCNWSQNSKLLSCRYTQTLPITVLTVHILSLVPPTNYWIIYTLVSECRIKDSEASIRTVYSQ